LTEVGQGVLLVDKPVGPTSHDIVGQIRRLTNIRRVGHTGTLDPLASGLLILCIGRATRLAEYLAGRPKSYEATVRLGQETSTYDREGHVVAERAIRAKKGDLVAGLAAFRGQIEQVPPMYSAVKVRGQPLYRHARQGRQLDRPTRQVTIFEIELVSWQPPLLGITVTCSSGTYVRSIAHDLGQVLGCGGHLAALRRVAVGELGVDRAVPSGALREDNWRDYLEPTDLAVSHLARVQVSEDDARRLLDGQLVPKRSAQPITELVRAYDSAGVFVGVLAPAGDMWQARKIFYR
jgi:tRNA pseudouridine55 synthase